MITISKEHIFDYSHLSIDFDVDITEYQHCTIGLWRFRARQQMNLSLTASRKAIERYKELTTRRKPQAPDEIQFIRAEMKCTMTIWRTELDNYKRLSSIYHSSAFIAL